MVMGVDQERGWGLVPAVPPAADGSGNCHQRWSRGLAGGVAPGPSDWGYDAVLAEGVMALATIAIRLQPLAPGTAASDWQTRPRNVIKDAAKRGAKRGCVHLRGGWT